MRAICAAHALQLITQHANNISSTYGRIHDGTKRKRARAGGVCGSGHGCTSKKLKKKKSSFISFSDAPSFYFI